MTLGPHFTMPTTTTATATTSTSATISIPSSVPAELPTEDDDDDRIEDNINTTSDPYHSKDVNTRLQSGAKAKYTTTLFRTVTISLIATIVYIRLLI